ncbi:galactose-specific lectin nattectin-like [Neosynchiropus ocellatus]
MNSCLSLVVVLSLASGLWIGAEHHCVGLGGNLASIHSDAEHQFVRGLIRRFGGSNLRTYVGGHDSYKEGRWSWSDGTNFVFPGGWHRGEPNNHGRGEDCLELNFHERGNDIPCGIWRPFVCSKPL